LRNPPHHTWPLKKRFRANPVASLTPWLGIAAIVILFDQLSKITITKLFVFGEEKVITSLLQPGAGL
jgi:signal peptidase II